MRVLHFGDIHVWRIGLAGDFWYPKRALGLVNLSLRRRFKFPPELAPRCAAAIAKEEADVVVFSGDMSTMSLAAEFREAARLFEPLHGKWTERLFVIPGNHDRYSPGSVHLYEKFFPYGAFEAGKRVRSQVYDGGLTVIGFDASRPFKVRSNGCFDEALEAELDAELTAQRDQSSAVILVGHFPFAYPGGAEGKWDHKLLGDDRLAQLVARHQPLAYLHGHKHQRWSLRDPRAPETLCLNCGPAGMTSYEPAKHAGWVSFEVENNAIGEVTACHLGEDGEVVRMVLDN